MLIDSSKLPKVRLDVYKNEAGISTPILIQDINNSKIAPSIEINGSRTITSLVEGETD